MDPKLRAALLTLGLRADATDEVAQAFHDALTDAQRSAVALEVAGVVTEPTPKADPPDLDAVRAEAQKAERDRIDGIHTRAAGLELPEGLVEKAIQNNWTVGDFAGAALDAVRRSTPDPVTTAAPVAGSPVMPGQAPAGHTRQDDAAHTEAAITAGLVLRTANPLGSTDHRILRAPAGLADAEADAFRQRAANESGRYRDLSLLDVCRMAIAIEGRQVPLGRDETIRAAFSTAAATNIFTDSVNLQLSAAFEAAPDSSGWAESGETNDFKTSTDVTAGKSDALEKLPTGGTARHDTFDDNAETYSISRYAKQLVIDERDIINDSTDALLERPVEMGEAAAQLRPDLVYAILLANGNLADGIALFHGTSHGANLDAAALTSANLRAGIAVMLKQQHGDRNLNIAPRFLIVPPDLKHLGAELINSSTIQVAAAGDTDATVVRGTSNPIRDDNLRLVTEARIANGVTSPDTGTTTSGDTAMWYLAAARRTIRVATLRGAGGRPVVRSFALTQGQWGLGWDIKHDVGAYARDFRGLYSSTTT